MLLLALLQLLLLVDVFCLSGRSSSALAARIKVAIGQLSDDSPPELEESTSCWAVTGGGGVVDGCGVAGSVGWFSSLEKSVLVISSEQIGAFRRFFDVPVCC